VDKSDFARVAQAALDRASELLPRWVGGRRVGNDWTAARTTDGGIGDSWSINLTSGVWAHFGGYEKGHDIVGFYAAARRIEQGHALREIEAELGGAPVRHPVRVSPPPTDEDAGSKADAIPEDAPPILAHPNLGRHTALYRYGNAFVVTRYDFTDEDGHRAKSFCQWTWRRGKWARQGYGDNRPLYRAHELVKHADSPVLIVEGEKCVELAAQQLRRYVVTTWAGGVAGVRQTDWSALAGRDVLIWPDADDPGRAAAAAISTLLVPTAQRVRAVNPNGADPGWDVADAIEGGLIGKPLVDWMTAHTVAQIEGPKKESEPNGEAPVIEDEGNKRALFREPKKVESRTFDAAATSALVTWDDLRLSKAASGIPHANTANGSGVLQRHPTFRNQIWFDDFCGEVFHTLRGGAQPWTDLDTRRVTVFIQEQLNLPKFTTAMMHEAVMHASECNIHNPVIEWLDSLRWDQIVRLENWLADYAGVELNDYSKAVSSNWLIGMVARAYRPGCKMDNMPVLEGLSGLNKTQLLEVLGGEWYKALPMEFGSKDFKQALRGAWLVEIPDMTGFGKVAHSAVLAELSIPIDHYRQSYGRRSAKYPRTCVFAATSETADYLPDFRGKRRYWPLRCTDINLDALRSARDQLFAEAVVQYKAAAKWYLMPEGTEEEQMARTTSEPWAVYILPWIEAEWRDPYRLASKKITTEDILAGAIGMKVAEMKQTHKITVARILNASKRWQQSHTRERYWVRIETPQLPS
jgi:putative DNA primase/helicase